MWFLNNVVVGKKEVERIVIPKSHKTTMEWKIAWSNESMDFVVEISQEPWEQSQLTYEMHIEQPCKEHTPT